jgi:hypothetical protein
MSSRRRAAWRVSPWMSLPLLALGIATLLTLCDLTCHVWQGVLVYEHPTHRSLFAGQPTGDVFLGFVQVGVFCALSGWALFRDAPPRGVGKTLVSAACFVACYAASGLAGAWPMSLHAAFLLTWLAHAATFPAQTRRLVAYAVVLGVVGPVWEGWGVENGFFHYVEPHAYHVPIWLTGLYMHGGLAVASAISTVSSWRRG